MVHQFPFKLISQKMRQLYIKMKLQSAHWSHQQVTIFTSHAWINKDVKESFAIISNNLNHTKEAVYTFMSSLFEIITQKYISVKVINIFSDGAASLFKQRYLFANLYEWQNDYSVQIIFSLLPPTVRVLLTE